MNINETYIKMCEKATELWEGRQFDIDDLVMAKDSEDGMVDGLHIVASGEWVKLKRGDNSDFIDATLCWGGKWFTIFRQFQLEQMVKRDNESWILLENRFDKSVKNLEHQDSWTAEQLWIAFVMKEKFNKQWDGGNWILAKTAK